MTVDKDPWCCAGDKLRINIDGFDAGYINALRSARTLVQALPKDEALAVLDELIAEFQPYRDRAPTPPTVQPHSRADIHNQERTS